MLHEIVAALIIRSNRVLLGKRSPRREFYPGVWDLFGGHVEPGEEQKNTLTRELQEELGITPTHGSLLETLFQPLPSHGNETRDELTVHLYLVTAWTGRPANRQPEEHSEIRWFSLDQTAGLSLADPSYPTLFALYLKGE